MSSFTFMKEMNISQTQKAYAHSTLNETMLLNNDYIELQYHT
jgi:hypothetical protein